MTRTEDRLTDALGAAAGAVREETLRPLTSPEHRPRLLGGPSWRPPGQRALHNPAWLAPAAAAVGIALVVGLAVLAARLSAGHQGQPAGGTGGIPRYYVEMPIAGSQPVVRSTATGAVTGTVPVPADGGSAQDDLLARAQDGTFFIAAPTPGRQSAGQQLYRFRLTAAGRVTGFATVPGGALAGRDWTVDAIAASPDGSQVAVSFSFTGPGATCGGTGQRRCLQLGTHPDYIAVVSTATGAHRRWRGGTGPAFSVASLSWANGGHELVFLGQTCGTFQLNSEACETGSRTAEVRAIDPASRGGRLDSGPVLLRQSALLPYLAQAYISPDGRIITAIVLRGRTLGNAQISGLVPDDLSVEQIALTTGKPLSVLYHRRLGRTPEVNIGANFLTLSPDPAGRHWLLNAGVSNGGPYTGFNGWLQGGKLVPLPPLDGRETSQAW